MLPLSPPKGGTKRDFAIFPVNFNLCRKKSPAKFLRVKTSSGKVVATSFLYLTVHRWIAGDVPIYLKFALKVTHPPPSTSKGYAEKFECNISQFSRAFLTQPCRQIVTTIAEYLNETRSKYRSSLCV